MSAVTLVKTSDIKGAAQRYVAKGLQTTELLETTAAISNNERNNILVCFGYEADFAASCYLQLKHGLPNVYNVYYSDNSDGKYHKGYSHTNKEQGVDLAEIQLFIGNGDDLNGLLSEHGLSPESMKRTDIGDYSILEKN